ncbi:MAG: GIY-YIG nuclease family protein [Pseudomonadota bacterium]
MVKHTDRMAEISFWAIPQKGTPSRERLDEELTKLNSNPIFKRKAKKNVEEAYALVRVQQQNGLGFPADTLLREYNVEYNGRIFNGSLHDLPGSFNVVEAFHEFLPKYATLELREEKDHLFSFDDFIDYVTSDSLDELDDNIKKHTENKKIYSYNSTSNPLDLEFSTNNGEIYGFSSVSLVRFDNEVSMVLLAGQICDLQVQTEKIKSDFADMHPISSRAHITPDKTRSLRAEPLIEGSNLWKTVVLVRFDLDKKTIDVRYVYHDCGQTFRGKTDDRDSYVNQKGEFISTELQKNFEKASQTINTYQALFELCKTCLILPKYFHDLEENVSVERHPTNFSEFRKKLKNKKIISLVKSSEHISYREAYVLSKNNRRSPTISTFFAPAYKVETSGFWKKLPPQVEGRDKNGLPIHGRTWVSQTLSWVEEFDQDNSILVNKPKKTISPQSGYIYVMRSAAHSKDIFKVGLTSRTCDIRANELSRSTSSPDHFLVVEEWYVSDCKLAEKLIHEKLDQFRINPNREYFKARYNVIFSAIDSVISSIDGI